MAHGDGMTKGKSHCRRARRDIVRCTVANARRRARQQQQARQYDRTRYDGSQKEES